MRTTLHALYQKAKRHATLSAWLLGLDAACLAFSVVSLIFLLSDTPLVWLLALLIPLGVGAAVGILLFILLSPTEKAAAKHLDEALSLEERMQTMLAFRDKEDDMSRLQREDAESVLAQKTKERIPTRGMPRWLLLTITLVSLACLVGTLIPHLLPRAAVPPAPEDPYDITPWQITAMEALIDRVETSDLEEPARELILTDLRALLEELKATDTISHMKNAVINYVLRVDTHIATTNSHERIAASLANGAQPATTRLYELLAVPTPTAVSDGLVEIGGLLSVDASVALPAFLKELDAVLTAVPLTEDALHSALSLLYTQLLIVESAMATQGEADTVVSIAKAFSDAIPPVSRAVTTQYTNRQIGNSVMRELMRIFGLTSADFPADDAPLLPDDPPEGEEPDKESSGGLGGGDTLYGSDDQIYDPDQNDHTAYGDLLGQYHAMIFEMFQDGKLPPELEEYFNDYFGILSDGSKKETDNNKS